MPYIECVALNVDPSKLRIITVEELRKHVHHKDCWIAIKGLVYDITPFFLNMGDEGFFPHPGGRELFFNKNLAGQDVTEIFEDVGHSHMAVGFLGRNVPLVGKLESLEDHRPPVSFKEKALEKNRADLKTWWSQHTRKENKVTQAREPESFEEEDPATIDRDRATFEHEFRDAAPDLWWMIEPSQQEEVSPSVRPIATNTNESTTNLGRQTMRSTSKSRLGYVRPNPQPRFMRFGGPPCPRRLGVLQCFCENCVVRLRATRDFNSSSTTTRQAQQLHAGDTEQRRQQAGRGPMANVSDNNREQSNRTRPRRSTLLGTNPQSNPAQLRSQSERRNLVYGMNGEPQSNPPRFGSLADLRGAWNWEDSVTQYDLVNAFAGINIAQHPKDYL